MNRTIAGSIALMMLAAAGAWLASNADTPSRPLVRLLLENERVRMREIVLPPGSSTGQHTHTVPELAYIFTDGRVRVFGADGTSTVEAWHAGEARWRDAGVTHEIVNDGNADMRVIVIDVR